MRPPPSSPRPPREGRLQHQPSPILSNRHYNPGEAYWQRTSSSLASFLACHTSRDLHSSHLWVQPPRWRPPVSLRMACTPNPQPCYHYHYSGLLWSECVARHAALIWATATEAQRQLIGSEQKASSANQDYLGSGGSCHGRWCIRGVPTRGLHVLCDCTCKHAWISCRQAWLAGMHWRNRAVMETHPRGVLICCN